MVVGEKNLHAKLWRAVILVLLVVITCLTMYPILYIVSVSFSGKEHILLQDIYLFPKGVTLASYRLLAGYGEIWRAYLNTVVYTVLGTLIGVVATVMLSFAVSQSDFYHRKIVIWIVMFTMFFSGGMIATYVVINKLKLYDTIWAVILPGSVNAWNMIITRTFYLSISKSIFDSANIDGCGPVRRLWYLGIPLAKPIIAVLTLYMIVGYWNTYFTSMLYISDPSRQLIQNFLQRLFNNSDFGGTGTDADAIIEAAQLKYTAIVVTMFPIMVVYPFLQKYFVHGIMVGSVKE